MIFLIDTFFDAFIDQPCVILMTNELKSLKFKHSKDEIFDINCKIMYNIVSFNGMQKTS